MTLYQFNALNEGEQIEFIWSQEAIASRQQGDQLVELYQVEDFYVEVFSREKLYTRIRPFKTLELLAPYLERIRVDL